MHLLSVVLMCPNSHVPLYNCYTHSSNNINLLSQTDMSGVLGVVITTCR